jgi:predicted transcriptional regulator
MINNRFTKKDRAIFTSLFLAKRPLPVKKLATKADMSWKTANLHVNKLKSFGVVNVNKTPRRTNVALDNRFMQALRKESKFDKKWRSFG